MNTFNKDDYTWNGIDKLIYKEDNSPFKDVTRQILFQGAFDLPVQFRYFEVGAGGFSTLEHHEHTHMVMIFRGHGQCLLGDEVKNVKEGDFFTISSHVIHQFRANEKVPLGFLCLVNESRDKVQLPTEAEIEHLKENPDVAKFLES